MKKVSCNRRTLLYGGFFVSALVMGGIVWHAYTSKNCPSAFKDIWSRFDGPRLRPEEQARVEFDFVRTVMHYYACKDFDNFFKYYRISLTESGELKRRSIQRARDHSMPDVSCSTEIHVLGYSTPPVSFVRYMGIMLLPDKEAKQLADLVDAGGGTITSAERALWKKAAFIEVQVGNHVLLTMWYRDGSRWWLLSFMDRKEIEHYISGY